MTMPWIPAAPQQIRAQKWNLPVVIGGGGGLKVWMGTEYVVKPIMVWSGTEWVEKPVKDWGGAGWLTRTG